MISLFYEDGKPKEFSLKEICKILFDKDKKCFCCRDKNKYNGYVHDHTYVKSKKKRKKKNESWLKKQKACGKPHVRHSGKYIYIKCEKSTTRIVFGEGETLNSFKFYNKIHDGNHEFELSVDDTDYIEERIDGCLELYLEEEV